MRRLFPPPTDAQLDPRSVYANLGLPLGRPDRPYVIMNMVSTVDGKSTLGQTAAGIGSRTDWLLMRQIRAGVDAILCGAGTLRAELVDPRVDPAGAAVRVGRGQQPQPLAVAVSASLDLDPGQRFLVNGRERTVVLTTSAAPTARRARLARYATLVDCDGDDPATVDLAAGTRRLRGEFGVTRLLSEGGPSLNQRLLEAGLIDELFWTIAPKLAGGSGPGLLAGPEPAVASRAGLDLLTLHEHDGELFARYRLRRNGDGSYRV